MYIDVSVSLCVLSCLLETAFLFKAFVQASIVFDYCHHKFCIHVVY